MNHYIRIIAGLTVLILQPFFASASEQPADDSYDLWAAQVYPEEYARLRDFFHLHTKQVDFTEGVTILALTSFDSLVGVEVIHKIRPRGNELNLVDGPKHWLNISVYDPDQQEMEENGSVTKIVTRIEKYRFALTPEQYATLVTDVTESGILSLPANELPEFNCYDGMNVHVDIRTKATQRLEARHVCDDGFESVKSAAEIIFSFAESQIPEMKERLVEIRRYY